jgi:hypothetical protein
MFLGMTIGGYVGWWAGEAMGLELMGALAISTIGSLAGVYVAWKLLTDYLS